MRHAILPRMSSYRVLHHDYMRTLVHYLSTIYYPMCMNLGLILTVPLLVRRHTPTIGTINRQLHLT